MLKYFRSSPLWLIGLFIIFAQATAGIAAVKIEGWPQAALVIFVISYSTLVTIIFFIFLWKKPENFYGPSEYGDIPPETYAKVLRGIPDETIQAVARLESNPLDDDALFSLMDNLLTEDTKQHLIFMRKFGDCLDISGMNEQGFTHRYEIITRNKGISMGIFSPYKFVLKLRGTELILLSGGNDKIYLTERGKSFADWLIHHERDAETFNSVIGRWGKEQTVDQIMKERFAKNTHNKELNSTPKSGAN